jgi:thioredoxin-related protein
MKTFFSILLAVALVTGAYSKDTKPQPADKILAKACKQAGKQDKKVMIIFHASWCGWCHRMDSIMNMPELKGFFEKNFVTEHLVVMEAKDKTALENPGAQDMMNKYNGAGTGIPYWLIFDAKGNLLADSRMPSKDKTGKEVLANVGCPAQPDEVAYFNGLLKKFTPLTDPDLALIAEKFTLKPVKR